jgi:hypothetical protein
MKYTIKYREELKDNVEKMSKIDQIQILKIITENNYEITENQNGCFINMNDMNDKIIEEIEKYIDYVNKKDTEINDIETQKETLKMNL